MTTIKTNHGTYTGRTVDTIIRREYGRHAQFRPASDPNSPEVGLVVRPDRQHGGHHVLGRVLWIETGIQ